MRGQSQQQQQARCNKHVWMYSPIPSPAPYTTTLSQNKWHVYIFATNFHICICSMTRHVRLYTICYDIQKGYVLSHNVRLKRQYNTYSFIHGCTHRTTCTCTYIQYTHISTHPLTHPPTEPLSHSPTHTHSPTHPHPLTHPHIQYIRTTVSERITHVQRSDWPR